MSEAAYVVVAGRRPQIDDNRRLLERFFARLAAVDVGGAPFLHPHRTMGGLIGAKEAPKLGIRHCFVRSPAVPGAFRQVDFILCPTEIIAHGLLGWSGSTSFQRSLRDYVNHAHEKNWAEVPDRRPIVGRRGWNVTRDGTRVGSLIEGRELDEDEHWAWSQNGIAIARGRWGPIVLGASAGCLVLGASAGCLVLGASAGCLVLGASAGC